MKKSILNIIADCDTRQWQSLSIPFGEESFDVRIPSDCVTLRMQPMAAMDANSEEITRSLEAPIGSPSVRRIISGKGKPPEQLRVCITVSDITRPVPYKGTTGMLGPLLGIIEATGVRRENIVILIGNGVHRACTLAERVAMYGQEVVDRYRIVDHNCDDLDSQVLAAHTSKGTEVHLNRLFY